MISNTALVLMLLRETGCLDSYEENTLKQELQSGDCHQGFGIFISYIPYWKLYIDGKSFEELSVRRRTVNTSVYLYSSIHCHWINLQCGFELIILWCQCRIELPCVFLRVIYIHRYFDWNLLYIRWIRLPFPNLMDVRRGQVAQAYFRCFYVLVRVVWCTLFEHWILEFNLFDR